MYIIQNGSLNDFGLNTILVDSFQHNIIITSINSCKDAGPGVIMQISSV